MLPLHTGYFSTNQTLSCDTSAPITADLGHPIIWLHLYKPAHRLSSSAGHRRRPVTNLYTLHHCTTAPLHHRTTSTTAPLNSEKMSTRRRAALAAPVAADDTDIVQGRQTLQPKPKKPTVAQNAQAIETLTQKISGVDAQLTTMNSLLAQLANGMGNDNVTIASTPNTIVQNAPQTQPTDQSQSQFTARQPGTPHCAPQQHPYTAGYPDYAVPASGASQQPLYGQQGVAYSAGGAVHLRARHHTTPAGPLPYPPAPSWPTTATPAPMTTAARPGSHHHTLTAFNQPPPANPWDHPTTLQDLEADPALTRRVAEAISVVATPFTGIPGKHAQFPHHLVTRGPKKTKTNLGELSMPEYTWGFLQIIKTKEFSDDTIPFMNTHLENILEDSMMYEWTDVRKWSEEVCTRIAKGTLRWADTYIIDRLQTQLSHKTLLNSSHASGGATFGRADTYEMSESVRSAKPGPPCRYFQTGTCTHSGDHVQKGYRQLHICSYCLASKCLLQPHPQNDCKTKKFNSQKKSQSELGFGS